MPKLEEVSFIDAHIHHWDPAKPEWYPFLVPGAELNRLGLGDISAMQRLYDQETYFAEARPWQIEGYVHVTAALAAGMHLPETDQLQALANRTGSPGAIIGTVDPGATISQIADELDRQVSNPHFRGIRIMEGLQYGTSRATEILGLLVERSLVYDLVVHPDNMIAAARTLERIADLPVVVEHAGGPTRPHDPSEKAAWAHGIEVLAERPLTMVKFSGLPMVLHQISVEAFRPWFEHIVGAFGSPRMLIGSNFPVDGLYGTLPQLLDVYLELARPLGPTAVGNLFANTARRVYLKQ
ncbi:amidohydrolase family protein [Rhodococcus erythropolis]|jgi:predicted TIM-barrel fold metal-dependent hydrolase|uniref:amidohydrolase family protein n=1 Tax=Rhodococcus erythropolis TaxID=1833 RepID=UPI0008786941|nr:amidohydrolase family protein [Rhodococcus erythropolis]OFV78030.1 amidohydrolase [Rhodococcus erythropolis]